MLHSGRYMYVECNGFHRPKKLLRTAYWSFRSPANEQHRKETILLIGHHVATTMGSGQHARDTSIYVHIHM